MAGHRDDGTFAEDKAHHPNRRPPAASGVCTSCASERHHKMTGNYLGTESMIPVNQVGASPNYLKGNCPDCGKHQVLFKTKPDGAVQTKEELIAKYGTWRTPKD